MKYSKQLRLLRKPGWILHYVDYELLRRYCNEPVAAAPTPADHHDERGCCDGGGAPATTAEVQVDALVRGLSTEQAQAAFMAALRGELRRANAFFLKQLELLRATLATTVEMTQVAADLEINDIRVSAARAALLDVSQRMDDLRDFASLNNTAVVKIAKKFDKRWGGEEGGAKTTALPLAQELLAEHSIASAADIAEMSATAGALARSLPAPAVQDVAKRPIVQSTVDMVTALDIRSLPAASFTFCRVQMGTDPVSEAISMPIMIAKGAHAGPVLGITSAVHGNELNGIPVIHRLFRFIDCASLCGTIVAVPVVNTHGYMRCSRGYSDGVDLNRIFPGKKGGTASQQFAHYFMSRVIRHLDFLLDLHTASFGRINSLYVRADMNDPMASRLAKLQNPQIIVHNTGPDGSLRGAAVALGKPAITIEIGNPQVLQASYIEKAYSGVLNTMGHLKMITTEALPLERPPVVCARSFWLFTETGGVLYVFPSVATWVRKGDVIAEIHSVFGVIVDRIIAPQDAIVVGKSSNPVAETGDRIIHLGVVEPTFPVKAEDGHA